MRKMACRKSSRLPRRASLAKRWLGKGVLFFALTLIVLSPNLERAYLQVEHVLKPEALIQPEFPGMSAINRQVDRILQANHGKLSEARLVARFVLDQIQYASDYETWGNVEYWPTAQETWQERREDCDGRAILATSILRSRGFHSARLVVGLDHMWVRVDENEKDPGKPSHPVALLNPNPNFSLELLDEPNAGEFWALARALLHPTALRETGTHLFADVPALRKAILVTALIVLCFHPCKRKLALTAVVVGGLAGVALLADWQPGEGHLLQAGGGAALICAAVVAALLSAWFARKACSAL